MKSSFILALFIFTFSFGLLQCTSISDGPMTSPSLQDLLSEKGLEQADRTLFLRAFKQEETLELWAKKGSDPFQLIQSYPFCVNSGTLGPKRKEGDRQIPEGVYVVNRFNPQSKFHLSLGLDYPNAADLVHGDPMHPGSDIFIHGGCASIGCIAITDEKISEVFPLCLEARDHAKKIAVHIFPFRMTSENMNKFGAMQKHQPHLPFWQELSPLYFHFEETHYIPEVHIDRNGKYTIGSD